MERKVVCKHDFMGPPSEKEGVFSISFPSSKSSEICLIFARCQIITLPVDQEWLMVNLMTMQSLKFTFTFLTYWLHYVFTNWGWGGWGSFPEKANKNKVLVLITALTCSCWPYRCSRRKKMGVAASPSSGLRPLPSEGLQCPFPGGVKWWQHRWAEQYLTLKLLHLQAAVFLFPPSPEGSRRLKHLIFFNPPE